MAMKVKFMPGIESMSGTMKSSYGQRVTFSHRRGDKPGEGHVRMWKKGDYGRSTPVTPEELQRRDWFAEATRRATEVMKNRYTLEAYHEAWVANRYCYGGKTYATLRGYIVTRMYNKLKNGTEE